MPFARFSRDNRGYEHIYLIHSSTRRGKGATPRILYWYRAPAHVKIGREPFDENIRHMLEEHYPDVTFEWDKLALMAAPTPEVEPWRDRRHSGKPDHRRDADTPPPEAAPAPLVEDRHEDVPAEPPPATSDVQAVAEVAQGSPQPPAPSPSGKRRRRRRRRHRSGAPIGTESSAQPGDADPGQNSEPDQG